MRECKVYVHDVEAGLLQETDDREYVFTYHDDYQGDPVCLAMPVRQKVYRSDHKMSGGTAVGKTPSGQENSDSDTLIYKDDFGIMLATAQYDTIGAVTIKPV